MVAMYYFLSNKECRQMNTRFYHIVWALLFSLGFTAVFIANLAHADRVSGAGSAYCVVPPSTTPGSYPACMQVFQSVQAAVDVAGNGDEIWVAAGHYTDIHTTPGYVNWSQILIITKSLTIRGGYAPPFTSPPDPLAHPTILDAQGQATTVFLLTAEATLTGLHITGGAPHGLRIEWGEAITISYNTIYDNQGDSNNWGFLGGGGVLLAHSTAVFDHNTIRNNLGQEYNGHCYCDDNSAGGGLAIVSSQVTLDSNHIVGNVVLSRTASYGDGGYGGGLWAQESVITLTNNTIMSNTAVLSGTSTSLYSSAGYGGGLALLNSQVYANGNDIRHNTAMQRGAEGEGGGLYSHNNPELHLVGNIFSDNVALEICDHCGSAFGGGLYVDVDYSSAVTPVIILNNNLIQGNIAAMTADDGKGGGLSFVGDFDHALPLSLHNNTFIRNTALISGGVGLGGGLFLANVQADLSHNQILSNTAAVSARVSFAGGLYMGVSHASLYGDLIMNNIALSGIVAQGGGIGIYSGDLTQTNVVLVKNRAGSGAALSTGGGPGHLTIIHSTIANNQSGNGDALVVKAQLSNGSLHPFSLTITNTIIAGHPVGIRVSSPYTVTVNGLLWYNTPTPISASITTPLSRAHQYFGNPYFADDGYHLLSHSAAIGQGAIDGTNYDIDGEPRRTPPDLGVDEFWSDKLYLPLIWRGP